MNRRMSALILAVILCCSILVGCSKENEQEIISESISGTALEEDGQNPVMNIIGSYMDRTSQRATMEIMCDGTDNASVIINWSNSATEQVVWEFSGPFDELTRSISYENCRKATVAYDESGISTETIEYENGTGTLYIQDDYTITWKDGQDDAGTGCVFEFNSVPKQVAE